MRSCEISSKNIDKMCKEETFYKLREDHIRDILKEAKRVNIETGKRIIEGLWKEYGNKCLDLLCDIDIDFGFDINVQNEGKEEIDFSESISQKLREVLGPLAKIKIIGMNVFKFIIEYYERVEKTIHSESSPIEYSISKVSDSGMEEGELEVDWEEMYKDARSNIPKLLNEEKFKEVRREIKKIREIPLAERVKIVKNTFESIGKFKANTDIEAVSKYVNNKDDQKKCLKILADIREGRVKIEERDGYCSSDNDYDKDKSNDPLLKAAKKAIEANDLPSLITLSKGCFLPSDSSVFLDLERFPCSLFEYSCKIYAIDCALYLLEEGGRFKKGYKEGDEPLCQALKRGNEEIGMFLIERGSNYKSTALHAALDGKCLEIAKLLIKKGVNIKAKDDKGCSPLHYASETKSLEVVLLLIEKGADVKGKDNNDSTPLHFAALRNSYEIAKLLIERGADINAKEKFNENTPLHYASHSKGIETVKLLIEKGADVNAKTCQGITPLHYAAFSNSIEIVKLLIEKGADVKAAKYNCYEVVKLLVERGADIEAKNRQGMTPLYYARSDQIKNQKKLEGAAKGK